MRLENSIYIVIARSSRTFANAFSMLLTRLGYKVELVPFLETHIHLDPNTAPPDLILMTFPSDQVDTALVSLAKERYGDVPLVLVGIETGIADVINVIRTGIRGWICPMIEPAELKEAIRNMIGGDKYYFDLQGETLLYSYRNDFKDPKRLRAAQALPAVEKQVLLLFASAMSDAEIAGQLQTTVQQLATLKTAISKSLQLKSRVGLALFVLENDLEMKPQPGPGVHQ